MCVCMYNFTLCMYVLGCFFYSGLLGRGVHGQQRMCMYSLYACVLVHKCACMCACTYEHDIPAAYMYVIVWYTCAYAHARPAGFVIIYFV